jgi:hypothetical protein
MTICEKHVGFKNERCKECIQEWREQTQPIFDWQYEVANGDTILGYAEWADHKNESERGKS